MRNFPDARLMKLYGTEEVYQAKLAGRPLWESMLLGKQAKAEARVPVIASPFMKNAAAAFQKTAAMMARRDYLEFIKKAGNAALGRLAEGVKSLAKPATAVKFKPPAGTTLRGSPAGANLMRSSGGVSTTPGPAPLQAAATVKPPPTPRERLNDVVSQHSQPSPALAARMQGTGQPAQPGGAIAAPAPGPAAPAPAPYQDLSGHIPATPEAQRAAKREFEDMTGQSRGARQERRRRGYEERLLAKGRVDEAKQQSSQPGAASSGQATPTPKTNNNPVVAAPAQPAAPQGQASAALPAPAPPAQPPAPPPPSPAPPPPVHPAEGAPGAAVPPTSPTVAGPEPQPGGAIAAPAPGPAPAAPAAPAQKGGRSWVAPALIGGGALLGYGALRAGGNVASGITNAMNSPMQVGNYGAPNANNQYGNAMY